MYGPLKRLITVAALTLIACFAFATATQESAMEEPAAFDWLRMYDHSYQDIANEDNPLFLFLEDKFNVDINLVHYHYDVFRQQRDVLVSSGDMADLFAAWDFDLATYGERLVQPYNDRLAAGDLPSFQAVLERNPGAQATLTEADGNMYNFPRFRGYPWIRKAPILRRDLLREGGFDGDTDVMSWDQFKAALQAMSRALDGEPAWLMRDGFTDFMREVPKAFGMNVSGAGANYPVSFDYDSGEYDIITRMPNLKWMILALKDLYDDGLLHPDFHNMAEDVWERHWNDGQVGLTFEWSAWATNTPNKVAKGWDLQFGMALTGPDGSTGHVIPHDPVNLTWGDLLYKDSEVQDEILEMVDWGYSDEGAIFFNLGIEGLPLGGGSRLPVGHALLPRQLRGPRPGGVRRPVPADDPVSEVRAELVPGTWLPGMVQLPGSRRALRRSALRRARADARPGDDRPTRRVPGERLDAAAAAAAEVLRRRGRDAVGAVGSHRDVR